MVGILKRRRSFCVFLPLSLLYSLSLSVSVSLPSLTFIMLPHSLIIISLGWIRFHNRTNSIENFSSPNLFTTAERCGRQCGRGLTAKAEIFPLSVSVCVGERESCQSSLLEASRQVQVHVEVEVVELFAGTRYVTTTTRTPTRTAMGTGIRLAALFFNW